MTNRNAYSNATRCGTYYRRCSACRCAPRLRASRLYSTQRFVCYFFTASLRNLTQRYASMRNSTICLLHRRSTLRVSARRHSPQRNDLFITFLSPPLIAALRRLPLRVSTHFDATICLLSPHRYSSQLDYALRLSTHFDATICLLRLLAAQRCSTQLCVSRRTSTPLNVTNQ